MGRRIECIKVPYLSRINEKKIIERDNQCSRCNKFSCWNQTSALDTTNLKCNVVQQTAQNTALEVVLFDLKHLSNNPYLLYCDMVSNAIVSDVYMCKTGSTLLPTKVVTFHIKPYF